MIRWTRLSCHSFAANAVRLQLHALAYNLGNFLRTLATPEPIKDWSLTSLKEKLVKIGAKVVSHGRYVAFQMAEVSIPRNLFAEILRLIAELRPSPIASTAQGVRVSPVPSQTTAEVRLVTRKFAAIRRATGRRRAPRRIRNDNDSGLPKCVKRDNLSLCTASHLVYAV
jgi:Transposase DDE domain group 1